MKKLISIIHLKFSLLFIMLNESQLKYICKGKKNHLPKTIIHFKLSLRGGTFLLVSSTTSCQKYITGSSQLFRNLLSRPCVWISLPFYYLTNEYFTFFSYWNIWKYLRINHFLIVIHYFPWATYETFTSIMPLNKLIGLVYMSISPSSKLWVPGKMMSSIFILLLLSK